MAEYEKTFNARGYLYNIACQKYPHARETERRLLIERLDLHPGHIVCDAPAGGGYLAEGCSVVTPLGTRVICVEPSAEFAKGLDPRFNRVVAPLAKLPFGLHTVHRIGSLAGLHHLERKVEFFHEAYRIMKPGGRFAVGDVMENSQAAVFLDDVVDRFSETGHRGMYLTAGDLSTLLAQAGFLPLEEQLHAYTWDFPTADAMAWFFKNLFGLEKATSENVGTEVVRSLPVSESATGVHVSWSLLYATGTKP